MTDTGREPCLLCAQEDADHADVVFRDKEWGAEIVPGYEVPGWIILRARRHAERITGLADAELATFGYRARDLVAAVGDVCRAPVTYLLVFGENYPHFHLLVAPRDDTVPADRRAGDILRLRLERNDQTAARALIPAIRDAYTARAAVNVS